MGDFVILPRVAVFPFLHSEAKRRKLAQQDENGQYREYLRPFECMPVHELNGYNEAAFETMPVQLLNCYGEASYNKMNETNYWKNMVMPQKSGAAFMNEMASLYNDRRGVGMIRASQHESVYDYDITPKDCQTPIAKRQTAAAGPIPVRGRFPSSEGGVRWCQ
jgi:hypothetical protein